MFKEVLEKRSGVIIGILVIALAGAVFLLYRDRQLIHQTQQPSSTLDAKKQEYLKVLRKLAVVPEEEPVVAEVEDADQVKNEPFLRRSQTGDVVFAFKQAKWAVLYRPSTKQVVDTTPITLQSSASAAPFQGGPTGAMPPEGPLLLPSPPVVP
jgi:hypothetical protein